MTYSIAGRWSGLFRKILRFGLLTAGVFMLNVTWAIGEHEAEKLQLNDNLSLSSLLTITMERHPQSGVLAARSATVDAQTEYANRWLPDTTGLSAFHMSDRSFDDIGAYENEVALSFPIWLPGEKKAQTRLGETLTAAQHSDEAQLRWRVSGHLRQQLWALKLAVRQWELAVEQEQRLAEVLSQVTLFAEAGELSRADQLATMEELAIWKGETMLLEAGYMDAIRTYRSFTGLETIPAQIDETLSDLHEIGQEHPALRQAMDHLAESSASTEVVRERSNLRPSLDVFWRGFRGDRRSPDVDALGIGFAMPLGKSPRREPQVAKAFEELAVAEAVLLETRRALELQLHEANHVLHTTRERLENSETIVKAATERHQLDKLAFELGEFSTREWLRRLSRFKEVERSHELL
ncbi:MAG: TolC family protein, partial [Xanthomonadales bacterium]|nr:TolC family protein [Xanthomonadales bacterium]